MFLNYIGFHKIIASGKTLIITLNLYTFISIRRTELDVFSNHEYVILFIQMLHICKSV